MHLRSWAINRRGRQRENSVILGIDDGFVQLNLFYERRRYGLQRSH